jgi:glycosyltransferase involved in cell wall biosynthesis
VDAARAQRGGVLLVGNLPDGPLVGGVEVGVEMLLGSEVAARHAMRLFNTARRRDATRPLAARLRYQAGRFTRFALDVVHTRPRVVHVKATVGVNYWQGAGYCAIGRILGRRVFLQLHGGDFDSWYADHGALARVAMRAALRVPSEVLVLSEYWRGFVAKLGRRARVGVVPNGVHTEAAMPRRRDGDTELRVVTIGAVGVRKGHFDIVDAAARMRGEPVRFVFAGEDEWGGETTALRERARTLGVQPSIDFLGTVTGPRKWALLAESDVFLLPSRGENMPNAVLEAMAAALPVVCTAVGALPEMLDEGALFVPFGDAEAIAQALRTLAANPARRAAMGAANRARAESRFAFAKVAAALDALYEGRDAAG